MKFHQDKNMILCEYKKFLKIVFMKKLNIYEKSIDFNDNINYNYDNKVNKIKIHFFHSKNKK